MKKYDRLIDYMLKQKSISYGNMYIAQLPEDSHFESSHVKSVKKLEDFISKELFFDIYDQDGEFQHIIMNKKFGQYRDTLRLYLCPVRKNLIPLVIEIIKRSIIKQQRLYLKYCRRADRMDQLIIYLEGNQDKNLKIELLKGIKRDRPELFEGMLQAINWTNETSIPNVYLQANPLINTRLGEKSSYGNQFVYALDDTKNILEYIYGVTEKNPLVLHKSDSLFYLHFERIFEEMLKRYGVFFWEDNNGNLFNEMCPGGEENTPLSRFEYDRKTGILTEIRDEFKTFLGKKGEKRYTSSQNTKEKKAFIEYLYSRKGLGIDDDTGNR